MDTLSYRNLYNAQLLQEPNANLRVDLISTIPNHLPILIICHPRLRPGRAGHGLGRGLIAQPPAPGTAGATRCSCCHGRAAQMRAVVDGSIEPSDPDALSEPRRLSTLSPRASELCGRPARMDPLFFCPSKAF
jgi:hypothetical protein